ncbi:lymphocyte cytosolic protein 2-like [Seriola lalandi dorsalis]|uniref:lymphocyte cytosolic protein 2-like n=2 Tax=Seriola lalandi dorsalis TaxID=1841481 RepID=UPI000C6F4A1B|nr:lymphocyte cytosolic protein 2-like [Seriola lalandi dorsalis]
MSLNNVPSKVEVMGWNPQSLADYMKRLKLSGCDKVVMRGRISGAQFMDNESDNDYESPEQEDNGYICALTEPQTAEQQDSDEYNDGDYKWSASVDTMKPPRHPTKTRASQPDLHLERSRKPGQPGPSLKDLPKSKGSTLKPCGSYTRKVLTPRIPRCKDVSSRASKLLPPTPVPTQPAPDNNSIPGSKQALDPSWYAGKVTRHQAEVNLREMNKDGAFVVRDSTTGSAEHPYTLMLLKQGKVYNIQIRNHMDSYSLGTGLHNTKSFPGVKEMITHHTHTPLLLIDATDQNYEAQSQCCLLHPAGL